MHECVTTSTYSMRAKPEGCMYLWLRTSAGECRQCVVISASDILYIDQAALRHLAVALIYVIGGLQETLIFL